MALYRDPTSEQPFLSWRFLSQGFSLFTGENGTVAFRYFFFTLQVNAIGQKLLCGQLQGLSLSFIRGLWLREEMCGSVVMGCGAVSAIKGFSQLTFTHWPESNS